MSQRVGYEADTGRFSDGWRRDAWAGLPPLEGADADLIDSAPKSVETSCLAIHITALSCRRALAFRLAGSAARPRHQR